MNEKKQKSSNDKYYTDYLHEEIQDQYIHCNDTFNIIDSIKLTSLITLGLEKENNKWNDFVIKNKWYDPRIFIYISSFIAKYFVIDRTFSSIGNADILGTNVDGQLIAHRSNNNPMDIDIWNTVTNGQIKTLKGFFNIKQVTFAPNDELLVSCSYKYEDFIQIWNIVTGNYISVSIYDDNRGDTVIEISPDSKLLAIRGENSTIQLRDMTTGKLVKEFTGPIDVALCITFSIDSKLLASGSYDHSIRIWDITTGKCICTLVEETRIIRCVAFSPSGKLLAHGNNDGSIRLWDLSTGKLLSTLNENKFDDAESIVFTMDSKQLISSSCYKSINIWGLTCYKCISTLVCHPCTIKKVAISPDGKLITLSYNTLNIYKPFNVIENGLK